MNQTKLLSPAHTIKSMKYTWYPYLANWARNAGLIGGQTDYVKFIVLGRSRVGSNFLRGLLNSHSRICAYGEIFRDYNSMDWDHMNYFQSRRVMASMHDDPAAFLDSRLFGKYPNSIEAVGFKIFYYHAKEGQWAAVWPYLQGQKDIRIIHLKRRNILETHLSRQKAAVTDQWVDTARTGGKNRPLDLDYQACLEDFVQTRGWEEEYDAFFADHPTLELFYEDLAADYEREMKRIQEFLGVEPEPVEPSTYKQSGRSLPEAIANYAELKEKFDGTPWAEFFVD